MPTSPRVDTESKGIVRRFLDDVSDYETMCKKFLATPGSVTSDFLNKSPKGAARAANVIARILPASARKPWQLDPPNRAAAWRFLAIPGRQPLLKPYQIDGEENHDFALHEHRSVMVSSLVMLNEQMSGEPGYVAITQHALGRLCQRGGARTKEEITKKVLALHDDLGRLPISLAEEIRSRPNDHVTWFPSTDGAWALESLAITTNSSIGRTEDILLVARTWLSQDDLVGEQEVESNRIRGSLLPDIHHPDAAASMDGPFSAFYQFQFARHHPAYPAPAGRLPQRR
jgi:hypothetical protein